MKKSKFTLITLCIVMVLTTFNNVWGATETNIKDDKSSVVAVKPKPILGEKQAVVIAKEYVRDFPMDEDVFIDLIEEEADNIFSIFTLWLGLDLMFIDIDFDGIPELFNYYAYMGARPFYEHKWISFSKGERTQYDIYVNEINTYDFRSLYVDSIFLKENTNGEKKFYIEYDYGMMGKDVYSCKGIFVMDTEEDIKTEKLSIICSPVAQVIEHHSAGNTIKYEVLDEKTGKLIETNETKYNKFVEDFKNTGCIDYLKTNVGYDGNYNYFVNNYSSLPEMARNYDPEQMKLVKESIINAAKEYIDLYKKSDSTTELSAAEVRGNSGGNISNGGYVAIQGDWIYCSGMNGIYKTKTDGTNRTQLSTDSTGYINVVDDWIYYCNHSEQSLYKMKTDGTNLTKLNSDYSQYIHVADDWIYYANLSDNWHLYKIKTDGTNRTKVNNDPIISINVVGDWIFYINQGNNRRIYKVKTDGTNRTKLSNDYSQSINVIDDWIYYQNLDDNSYIYKMKTDGSNRTKVNNDSSMYINVVGDWIYYCNNSNNGHLYKIKTDGSDRTKLNSDNSWNINVVGDWVYYHEYTPDKERAYTFSIAYYRIKTDGTKREKVN